MRKLFFVIIGFINWPFLIKARVSPLSIQVNGILFFNQKGSLKIGKGSKINSSKIKNVIGGDTRTSLVVKKGAYLTIGKNVKISNSAFYCADSITIGDNVMIGGSTKIWDTDFHPLNPTERLKNPNEGYNTRPIIIHENAFIGGFSIILKGAEIGTNSVIGAGSVVSGKVPPNEVWAGNPAKFIKKITE